MSKTLGRLRELFNDPLFTRTSHGMRPTPRAQELDSALGAVLAGIHELVAGQPFEPQTWVAEVTLALSEYIGLVLLPELTRRLASLAPRLSIRVITRVENQLEQLALGELDFAIHVEHTHYGPEYRVEKLGSSPTPLLARDDHPLRQGSLELERLIQYPLIKLYVSDSEQLEIPRNSAIYNQLLANGRGSLETSHLLTALEVLRNTDYIMPCPAHVLQNEGATRGISALPLPASDNQSINYALVAHNRTAHSPLHNWLWEQITCTIRDLRTPLSRKMRQRVAAGRTDRSQEKHE